MRIPSTFAQCSPIPIRWSPRECGRFSVRSIGNPSHMIQNDDHLYLEVAALKERGWTDTLIERFLGKADQWEPVSHWANFTGKRTYHLERIESAEGSDEFDKAYRASLLRRRITRERALVFRDVRAKTNDAVRLWKALLTREEAQRVTLLKGVGEMFREARRRGYRTPHKC